MATLLKIHIQQARDFGQNYRKRTGATQARPVNDRKFIQWYDALPVFPYHKIVLYDEWGRGFKRRF